MENNIYLICCAYHHNHVVNRDKIESYCQSYTDILYNNKSYHKDKICLEPIYWKRLYNQYGAEALRILEDNITYCEIRQKINDRKHANK